MENRADSPNPRRMLFQFSLYGFLKNQQYFDPFLMLFFLEAFGSGDKLAFFKYGLLVGYADVVQNPGMAQGQWQVTENRIDPGGIDGFRRRVHTATVRPRNVGIRPLGSV